MRPSHLSPSGGPGQSAEEGKLQPGSLVNVMVRVGEHDSMGRRGVPEQVRERVTYEGE